MNKAEIGAITKSNTISRESIHTLLEEGELGAMLDLKVWDTKTGNVTFEKSKKAESFVRQFLELLYVQIIIASDTYPVSIRDTGNTLRNICAAQYTLDAGYIFDVLAVAGTVTYGIVVGTGNAAPTINDYVLQTPIAHGVGAGQLQYSIVSFGAPAADATVSQLTITRNFANGSGGAITVEEVGLYCRALDTTPAARYLMIIRDVTGGINVPNGQTLTVNYRPQAAV